MLICVKTSRLSDREEAERQNNPLHNVNLLTYKIGLIKHFYSLQHLWYKATGGQHPEGHEIAPVFTPPVNLEPLSDLI